jgi:site-specific DNA-cytosine methylase
MAGVLQALGIFDDNVEVRQVAKVPFSAFCWDAMYLESLGVNHGCFAHLLKTFASSCSGLGTASLCVKKLSADSVEVFSSEKEPKVRAFFKANFEQEACFNNAEECLGYLQRESISPGSILIFIAGPPCTPFTLLTIKRSEPNYDPWSHPDSQAFRCTIRIIVLAKPKAFILENVKSMLSKLSVNSQDSDDYKAFVEAYPRPFDYLLKIFEDEGLRDLFDIHVYELNARNFGLPQTRQRIYIVGVGKTWRCNFASMDRLLYEIFRDAICQWTSIASTIT